MAGLADFIVRLALDSRKFSSGADTAKKDIKELVDQFDKGGSILGRFGDLLSRVTGGAGIAGAGAAGFKIGREAEKAAGELNDLADAMDTTAASVQRLQYAGGVAGAPFEGIKTGVEHVRKSQSEALQGNQGQVDDFARLGVSVSDLKSMNGEEIFLKIAKGVETGAINAANFSSLLAVMGKQANDLVPAFKDGLASAADEFDRLGVSIRSGVINDLDSLDKTWTRIWQNIKSGTKWLAGNIVGGISSLTKFGLGAVYAASGDKETASDILSERELMNDGDYSDSLDQSAKLQQRLDRAGGVKREKAKQAKEKADKDAAEAKKLRETNAKKLSEMRVNALPASLRQIQLERDSAALQDKIKGTPDGLEREKLREQLLETEQRLSQVKPDTRGALTVSARTGDNLTRQGLFSGPAESAVQRATLEQVGLMRQQIGELQRITSRLDTVNRNLTSIEPSP